MPPTDPNPTSTDAIFTYSAVAIGLFYTVSGLLTLTMNRRAAAVAIILLIADGVGRVALVATGFYPIDSPRNTFSIIVGTAIVVLFAIYIGWRRKTFR